MLQCEKALVPDPAPFIKPYGIDVAQQSVYTMKTLRAISDIRTVVTQYAYAPLLHDSHTVHLDYWYPDDISSPYMQRLAKQTAGYSSPPGPRRVNTVALDASVAYYGMKTTTAAGTTVARTLQLPQGLDYAPAVFDSLLQRADSTDTLVYRTSAVDSPWIVRSDTFFQVSSCGSSLCFDSLSRTRTSDTATATRTVDREVWYTVFSATDTLIGLQQKTQIQYVQGDANRVYRSLINSDNPDIHADSIVITTDTTVEVFDLLVEDPTAQWWSRLDSAQLRAFEHHTFDLQGTPLRTRRLADTSGNEIVRYDFTAQDTQSLHLQYLQYKKGFPNEPEIAESTDMYYRITPTGDNARLVRYTSVVCPGCDFPATVVLVPDTDSTARLSVHKDSAHASFLPEYGPLDSVRFDYDIVYGPSALRYRKLLRTDYVAQARYDSITWLYTPASPRTLGSPANTVSAPLTRTVFHTPRAQDSTRKTVTRLRSEENTQIDSLAYTWIGKTPGVGEQDSTRGPLDTLTYSFVRNRTSGMASYRFSRAYLSLEPLTRQGRITEEAAGYTIEDTFWGTHLHREPRRVITAAFEKQTHTLQSLHCRGVYDTFSIEPAPGDSLQVCSATDTLRWHHPGATTFSARFKGFDYSYTVYDPNTLSGSFTPVRDTTDIRCDNLYVSPSYAGIAHIYGIARIVRAGQDDSRDTYARLDIALWHQNMLADSIPVH
jgi:hypothetical protein